MTHYGYGRVSTTDQNLEGQDDALQAAGCTRIYVDDGVSGKLTHRPELDKLWAKLVAGDKLTITKMDRIGRSTKHLLELANELRDRGVALQILNLQIDTSTPAGKLMFTVMAGIAEFERDLIVERTHEGLAAARARGRVGGRKPKLSPKQIAMAREMVDSGKTIVDVAAILRVSRPTIYAALKPTQPA